MPLPLEITFQTFLKKKKVQDSLYRFAAKRNRILNIVNPSKVLGTKMPNDLFKNYWFGMMLSFAKWFLKHFTTEQEPDRSNNAFLKP